MVYVVAECEVKYMIPARNVGKDDILTGLPVGPKPPRVTNRKP